MNNELNSATQAQAMPELPRYELVESSYGSGHMVHWDKALELDPDGEWCKYADVIAAAPPSPQPVADCRALRITSVKRNCTAEREAVVTFSRMVTDDELAAWAITPAAALQPVARQDEAGGLPLIRAAFRTERQGGTDGYSMVFRFMNLKELQQASREWRAFRTAPAIEPVAGLTDADLLANARDAIKGLMSERGYGCGEGSDHQVEQYNAKMRAAALASISAIERHITGQAGATGESK